jgi:maltose O-acetyltransferase
LIINIIVLAGVEIGSNTIIGSGSIVTESIRANVLTAGNHSIVIRQIRNKT